MEFQEGAWVDFTTPTQTPRNSMSKKNTDFPELLINAELEFKTKPSRTKRPLTSFHTLFNSANYWLAIYNVYWKK